MLDAKPVTSLLLSAALVLGIAAAGQAEPIRTETVATAAAASGTVIEGQLKGDETVDYVVAATAGQRLSVDLSSANTGLYFNILPQGQDTALFIGSSAGLVADISVPATGNYVVRVYLMRNAAGRDEGAAYTLGIGLAGADFADGLSGGPDWWQVAGLDRDALNVRLGPDSRYGIVGKARNGDVMQNLGCRLTGQMRWCNIQVSGSGVQGWVAGQYLIETAAPAMPETPEGGPVGNGTPFDATGSLECSMTAGAPLRLCPFGVVRSGPGNAGIWVALGEGRERAILFEGGQPVSADLDAPLSFERVEDLFTIRIGAESYRFPEALVNGG